VYNDTINDEANPHGAKAYNARLSELVAVGDTNPGYERGGKPCNHDDDDPAGIPTTNFVVRA